MTYTQRLLLENASQTALFVFQADPPTVTSQRLKGLTTGSLPTFIDISANFDSAEIKEDNLVAQLHSQKGSSRYTLHSVAQCEGRLCSDTLPGLCSWGTTHGRLCSLRNLT
jgi:hypothetical protein